MSNTGTWMQRVAQDWLVLHLTGSGTALGVATALQFLPLMLLGLWGGDLADRYPRRRLLLMTQSTMGVLAGALAVLDLAGAVRVWQVYLFALLLGMATAVDNPVRQSFVVEMVGPDDLANAVSLNSANFNLGRITGPAVSGVLIGLAGTGWVFAVNAVSYLAVIAGLLAMRPSELRPQERAPRGPGRIREGLAYVRSRRDLLAILVIVGFVGMFGLNTQITNALFATRVFHRGAASFGLLSTAMAVGSLAGALLAARRIRPRTRTIVLSGVVFGALEMVAAVMPAFWLFAAALVPAGLAALMLTTTANATMQIGVAPELRGRVMGLYMLVFLGTTPLGAPLIGWIGGQFGPRWTLLVGGGVSALATIAAAALLARGSRGAGARRSLTALIPRARTPQPRTPQPALGGRPALGGQPALGGGGTTTPGLPADE